MGFQFLNAFTQGLPKAIGVDTTLPTFAGIIGTTPNEDGSITATWNAGTVVNLPIHYAVYIALGSVSASTLFVGTNQVMCIRGGIGSARIFMLSDLATYLVKGQAYTLGVRAIDAYNQTETNVVVSVATAIASGNIPMLYSDLLDAASIGESVWSFLVPASPVSGSFGEFVKNKTLTVSKFLGL